MLPPNKLTSFFFSFILASFLGKLASFHYFSKFLDMLSSPKAFPLISTNASIISFPTAISLNPPSNVHATNVHHHYLKLKSFEKIRHYMLCGCMLHVLLYSLPSPNEAQV